MSLGCAACGACCDPVTLEFDCWLGLVEYARSNDEVSADAAFIAQHWHPVIAWRDPRDGRHVIDLRCDAFDPQTRLCTARDDRPPVCRDYPWYGEDPAIRAGRIGPQCSYLLDVPPSQRPEGSRPLIPITPV